MWTLAVGEVLPLRKLFKTISTDIWVTELSWKMTGSERIKIFKWSCEKEGQLSEDPLTSLCPTLMDDLANSMFAVPYSFKQALLLLTTVPY